MTLLRENAEDFRLRIAQTTEENRTALDAQFDQIFTRV
jgi:hypothetical protein